MEAERLRIAQEEAERKGKRPLKSPEVNPTKASLTSCHNFAKTMFAKSGSKRADALAGMGRNHWRDDWR